MRPRTFAGLTGFTTLLYHSIRTEKSDSRHDAAAMGLGVFIGCTPFYGFHLVLVLLAGWLLGLNRLKMYIGANISNPLFAPALILLEVQAGAWLRRGTVHSLTLEGIRRTDPWIFGLDLLLGSLVVGAVAGGAVAVITWAMLLPRRGLAHFDRIAAAAADRYIRLGIIAWEFARGKLRRDPIYHEVLQLLPSGRRLVDIGCGQGLMLAALAEARVFAGRGEWPSSEPPPIFQELIGIELRRRIACIAADALGADATIICRDARDAPFAQADAVLLFDVLHMIPAAAQEDLLRVIAGRMSPTGIVLIREADAGAGRPFQMVRIGNTLKALVTGNWKQRFAFRSAAEWQRTFSAAGFVSSVQAMREGTPFGNVLFTLATADRKAAASAVGAPIAAVRRGRASRTD